MVGKGNPQIELIDQLSVNKPPSKVDKVLTIIDQFVDWGKMTESIRETYADTGRPSIDPVLGLKCLLLSQLYELSFPELEEHGNDSIAFRRFLGLDLSGTMPDQSTLWRFRERIVQHHLGDHLFEFVRILLEEKGLILKRGTIVDATLVEASRRAPEKDAPVPTEPRGSQEDRDATEAKKNNRYYYGYKGHIGIDRDSGLIRRQTFTTAALHDSRVAECLISGDEQTVHGDKAYDNGRIRQYCADHAIQCEIHEQARRGHPLTPEQQIANKRRSKVRQGVERVFAHFKRVHRYRRVRSVTLLRNAVDFLFLCIGYDLKRCTVLFGG